MKTCEHGVEIEFPESPEMDCVHCAMAIIDLGPCYGCRFLLGNDKCLFWNMAIRNNYRRGVESCEAREQR